jgi:hypothetical protein
MPRKPKPSQPARDVINMYTCEECHAQIVTRDVDAGVTPMFIRCRVTRNCKGTMTSSMYQVDQTLVATHEWYRPLTRTDMTRDERYHVRNGGLALREVGRRVGRLVEVQRVTDER